MPAPNNGQRAEVQVCITDGNPFFLTEHNFKLGGSWRNWATCIQNVSDQGCPLCQARARNSNLPISSYDASVLTVVNMTGYTNRETGEPVKNYRELLVIKGDTIQKFKNWDERKNGLRGCVYVVTRTGSKKESIGDDWDYTEKLSDAEMEKQFGENAAPLDYSDLLPIKSFDELSSIVSQITGEVSVTTGGGAPTAPGTSTQASPPAQNQTQAPAQSQASGSVDDDVVPF